MARSQERHCPHFVERLRKTGEDLHIWQDEEPSLERSSRPAVREQANSILICVFAIICCGFHNLSSMSTLDESFCICNELRALHGKRRNRVAYKCISFLRPILLAYQICLNYGRAVGPSNCQEQIVSQSFVILNPFKRHMMWIAYKLHRSAMFDMATTTVKHPFLIGL